jgi:hypothetical protein
LIAVIAVVGNEFFDRDVAGDKQGHPFGDFLVAVVLVGIVFYVLSVHRSASEVTASAVAYDAAS